MEKENKQETIEKKEIAGGMEIKPEEKKEETAEAREKKKPESKKQEITKKEKAVISGNNLSMSTKHGVAICNFIRGKKIEEAVKMVEDVIKYKRAIPMSGEVGHRKGLSIRKAGRYPINACKIFIKLLKSLNANASVNGIGEPCICLAKSNKASRPYRRFGSRRFKRTNVYMEAREKKEGEK